MALKFDLLPDELRAKAAQYLADDIKANGWHLSTGFVGVSYLLPVLTEAGKVDTAYRLLMQDTFPSWLFSVKHGATTIWERWDGWTPENGFQDPGMNSFNHYSLGSCGQWLFETVAGIGLDPEQPGYRHIIIHPRVGGGLTWAKRQPALDPRPDRQRLEGQGRGVDAGRDDPRQHDGDRLRAGRRRGLRHGVGQARGQGRRREVAPQEPGEAVFEVGSGTYTFASPRVQK